MDNHVVWDRDRAERWLARSLNTDRQLRPVTELLFAAANLVAGERVIDVGCGDGPTTRFAADSVGPTGGVTGLDVSPTMIEAATQATIANEADQIEWIVADAVAWNPPVNTFDALISRFGVMFFSDPERAFTNLAAGMKASGRLAFATWAERDQVELFDFPYQVALQVARNAGMDPDPVASDGGPFSLGDRDQITTLLQGAGWREVDVTHHALTFRVGGGLEPADAAEACAEQGPARLLIDNAPQLRQAVTDALAEKFALHRGPTGQVELGGTVLITTANRNPGEK